MILDIHSVYDVNKINDAEHQFDKPFKHFKVHLVILITFFDSISVILVCDGLIT